MYSAVIIEPRCHGALSFVLNNFLDNLDDNWNIILFHGNTNHKYIKYIIHIYLLKYVHRIHLINLNIDNLTIDDYNLLLKSSPFYNYIPTEMFLIFQTDTMIFKENKQLIHLFMEYDYVGAPWEYVFIENEAVGNGGFSLRRKSKMLEIIQKNPNSSTELMEDAYFCYETNTHIHKPSLEKAKLFSVEQIYSEITFGCHKPWHWDNYEQFARRYPEVETLKRLQYIDNISYTDNIAIVGLRETIIPKTRPHPETQYIDLIHEIINNGVIETGRNGDTKSIFGCSMRYSLLDGELPLLTTKKVAWKTCFEELKWFIRGSTNNEDLLRKNVHIWDGNASREFLDKQCLHFRKENDLGPIYGHQWRHFNAPYIDCNTDYSDKGIDQLQYIIDQLQSNDPIVRNSRRLIMCAWNPSQIHEMALPPCHALVQFNVSENKYLSCSLYQRSGDVGLGIPFNIASYSLLTHIIAKHCNLIAKEFVHFIGNAHIYCNHIDALREQIQRTPLPFPKINIKTQHTKIEDYDLDDLEFIQKYEYYPPIKMEMIA